MSHTTGSAKEADPIPNQSRREACGVFQLGAEGRCRNCNHPEASHPQWARPRQEVGSEHES